MYKLTKITQHNRKIFMECDDMKNLLIFCLAILLFSVGIILGAELNSIGIEKKLAEESKKIDSIQDVVIRNVQNGQNDSISSEEDERLKAVTAIKTKISPYATLTIEKFYKGCGHTTKETIDIPKELVNMTEEELQQKYEKWTIKEFKEREVYLYREIDANCSSHFVVKEDGGKVAVFSQITDNNVQLKEITDIDFDNLRDEDKELIREGVVLYGEEELSSFIEDFES